MFPLVDVMYAHLNASLFDNEHNIDPASISADILEQS